MKDHLFVAGLFGVIIVPLVLTVGMIGFIPTRATIQSLPVWIGDSLNGQRSAWCAPEGQSAHFDGISLSAKGNLVRDLGQVGLGNECYDDTVVRNYDNYTNNRRTPQRVSRVHHAS